MADQMEERGLVMWHTSCEDMGGPDVGISVGLGGACLFAGEVPGEVGPWSLAIYATGEDRQTVAASVDKDAARDMIEMIGNAIAAAMKGANHD